MVDWSIRVGDMLVMISLAGALTLMAYRTGTFTGSIENMREDIKELREMQRDVVNLLKSTAVQDQKIVEQNKRINTLDERLEDLRHGRGFIVRSPTEHDQLL